ncbi:MAG: RsmB/NOP family class I SAM-dependent RNA methyltransferase [Clostridiales bacterium]|nr:RsmB/NOP family class I SAM-dependent RNA methyltransferase [Clostridiales bacterium]
MSQNISAKLPEEFSDLMRTLLRDEFAAYLKSLDSPREFGLRVNLLKSSASEVKSLLPYLSDAVPWCSEGFYYDSANRPAKSPHYRAGLFYLQEPSAMAPAALAQIFPGQKVLDLCAAPGGKSTQAAGFLRGAGLLAANDVSPSRCRALVKNLELCGARNAVVLSESPERLASRLPCFFDRILLDAPCSGEGMFRKDPAAMKAWSVHKPQQCIAAQRGMLFQAAKMLRPGGRMVYSTCTFEPGENEGAIEWFLNACRDFSVAPVDHAILGLSPAMPDLACARRELAGAARIWPHRQRGEGHFICVLEKSASSGEDAPLLENTSKKPDLSLFHEFCDRHLTRRFSGNFLLHGQSLYLAPEGLPGLDGLRLARSGWYLGDVKLKRFEPSQAFAMGLSREDSANSLEFSSESGELLRYFKGESFEVDAKDGWALACTGGHPIGWGKVADGRMKNKYLKSWIEN